MFGVKSLSMAGTSGDDNSIGPRVQSVLREVANFSHDEVQQVFRGIVTFPPICATVLNRTAAILTNVLEESREDSNEGLDEPRQRSERLKKVPPTVGRTRSARKKKKAIAPDSSSEDWQSEENRSDTTEEDSEDDDDTGGNGNEEVCTVGVESGKEVPAKAKRSCRQTLQKLEVSILILLFSFCYCCWVIAWLKLVSQSLVLTKSARQF